MLFADPDYPHVVMAFVYRGFRLEIDRSEDQGLTLFSVWATYDRGCAVLDTLSCQRQSLTSARRVYPPSCTTDSLC